MPVPAIEGFQFEDQNSHSNIASLQNDESLTAPFWRKVNVWMNDWCIESKTFINHYADVKDLRRLGNSNGILNQQNIATNYEFADIFPFSDNVFGCISKSLSQISKSYIPYVRYPWPFPSSNTSASDDFENILTKTWTISIKDSLIVKWSWKQWNQMWNCSSWAISPLATLFLKVVCCKCVQTRLQEGKD